MRNLRLIIRREYLARVRNRTFVIMTFLSPIILVGMVMLIVYLVSLNSGDKRTIALLDQTGIYAQKFKDTPDTDFIVFSGVGLDQAKSMVQEKGFQGLLYITAVPEDQFPRISFFGDEAPALGTIEEYEKLIGEEVISRQLEQSGVDLSLIEETRASINIVVENFSGVRTSKMSTVVRLFFGGAAGYLLMMFIIIYGNMVMRSVIEEKTSRIIEIIVSSVKPVHLMLGKILGTSFAGLTQFLIWVLLGAIMLAGVSALAGLDPATLTSAGSSSIPEINQNELRLLILDIMSLPLLTLILSFLIYFFGGYFLYSGIYAAIGAAVSTETDTQQFMLPIILPPMLGIYVGFFAVIENPHGIVSVIFSMIPLTSPIVMLMRIPFGVPWWELGISLVLLFISIGLVVWLAAKIYKVGILSYGKRPGYKELYKWLKY